MTKRVRSNIKLKVILSFIALAIFYKLDSMKVDMPSGSDFKTKPLGDITKLINEIAKKNPKIMTCFKEKTNDPNFDEKTLIKLLMDDINKKTDLN